MPTEQKLFFLALSTRVSLYPLKTIFPKDLNIAGRPQNNPNFEIFCPTNIL